MQYIYERKVRMTLNKLIVHGVLQIEDRVLLIQRSKIKRGKQNVYPLYWDVPGGSVEEGELPTEALIREFWEEVQLHVAVKDIIHEDSNFDHAKNIVFTRLVYNCHLLNQNDELKVVLDPEEHFEFRWIKNMEELIAAKEHIVPYLLQILK